MADDELVLEPSPNGRVKRKKLTPEEKLDSGSATVRLEGAFEIGYLERWGFPYYQTNPSEDRKHLKQMAETLGETTARALIDLFFRELRPVGEGGDPELHKWARNGNVRNLNTQVAYLLRKQTGKATRTNDRTSDNISEIMKATGRKK